MGTTSPTTLICFDRDAPRPPEENRRADMRVRTLFRVGALRIDGMRQLCLIKNVSSGGARIRPYEPLLPGQKLRLELGDGTTIPGAVKWVDIDEAGIQFDAPIDVLDFLGTRDEGMAKRRPRVEIDCPIILYHQGIGRQCRALDISQGGVKIEAPDGLPGDEVDIGIALPGHAPRRGCVRWVANGVAGIGFNTPMPLDELVAWLRECREGVADHDAPTPKIAI